MVDDFSAHIRAKTEKWKGVIGKNCPSDFNCSDMTLMPFLSPPCFQHSLLQAMGHHAEAWWKSTRESDRKH
ncbi:unnamed protein product [Soboliphyme baturini]|uniref:Uncharacterized protein n=1 Tax=Soboliphyme baturini TaxID=241478 RepID=A0A183IED9_9BILA|nr:unnamed protein product [Soboliphyme baturini]